MSERIMFTNPDFLLHITPIEFLVRPILKNLSPTHPYHGEAHTFEKVYPAAMRLVREERFSSDECLRTAAAALFHDTGFADRYILNERFGARRAIEYIMSSSSETLREGASSIYAAIHNTDMQEPPRGKIAKVLRDADQSILGQKDFLAWNDRLRAEAKLHPESSMFSIAFDDTKWATTQLAFLKSQKWFTPSAQKLYQAQKEVNIHIFKNHYAKALKASV